MKLRDKILAQTTRTASVKIEGLWYTYHVVRVGFEPELPLCSGYPIVEEPGRRMLFISQEVPDGLMPAFIAHEVFCVPEMDKRATGCCTAALVRELAYVPVNVRDIHLTIRARYFDDMLRYAEAHNFEQHVRRELAFARGRISSLQQSPHLYESIQYIAA